MVTIDSAVGVMIAAPTPCSARAAISEAGRPREPAQQRREREQRQPGHEDAAPPEQVGGTAAEQQQAAERERVCAQDPLQVLGEKPRSSSIDGSATTTIAASRMTMKNAPHSSASALQRRGSSGWSCHRKPPCFSQATCVARSTLCVNGGSELRRVLRPARALELVGERWGLLVIRELLAGPKRFTDLASGLPRIPSNVLSARLKELEQHGVVERRVLPRPSGAVVYELTDYGRELDAILVKLAGWGARSAGEPREGDAVSPTALVLGLRGIFRPEAAGDLRRPTSCGSASSSPTRASPSGELEVAEGPAVAADLTIEADRPLRARADRCGTRTRSRSTATAALFDRFVEIFRIEQFRARRCLKRHDRTTDRRPLLRRVADQAGRYDRRAARRRLRFTGPVASFDDADGFRAMAREAGPRGDQLQRAPPVRRRRHRLLDHRLGDGDPGHRAHDVGRAARGRATA